MNCLDELVRLASDPISRGAAGLDAATSSLAGHRSLELAGLLKKKNGFYAFESALHVFPADSEFQGTHLQRWNTSNLWRNCYGILAEGCLFFAEDIFGGQFCIYQDEIYLFDPETGLKKWLAQNLENWADVLLGDYEFLTGFPLAHEWQLKHGPIRPGYRLVPKKLFTFGGDFELENLALEESLVAMRRRGDIATQIERLPDGTAIELRTRE